METYYKSSRPVVIDEANADRFYQGKIERQWTVFAQSVRRQIEANAGLRGVLQTLVTCPVTEDLPGHSMSQLADLAGLNMGRYSTLAEYLSLPQVPTALYPQGVMSVNPRPSVEWINAYVNRAATLPHLQEKGQDGEPKWKGHIKALLDVGDFDNRITPQEQAMILQRSRFARDLKLLALMAELTDVGGFPIGRETKLPSGVLIYLEPNLAPDDLDPSLWIDRRAIKDRVHLVRTAKRNYILKEKKSVRHHDTLATGIFGPLSIAAHEATPGAQHEFMMAKHFRENLQVEESDIAIRFEHPLGYVVFPDGYQFVIFECEEDLILPSQFEAEMKKVILKRPADFAAAFRNGRNNSNFESFAYWHAKHLYHTALKRYEGVLETSGYITHDNKFERRADSDDLNFYDCRFKIEESPAGVKVVIFGFDFEYFYKESAPGAV